MQLRSPFDQVRRTEKDGWEYWTARELMKLLGYTKWQNFKPIIEKAKTACDNAGFVIDYHFTDISKMVTLGSGSKRKVEDVRLSRYACHLIAMNGEPRFGNIKVTNIGTDAE